MIIKLALSVTSFIPLYIILNIFMYIYSLSNNSITSSQKKYIIIIICLIILLEILFIILINIYIKKKLSSRVHENEIKFKNILQDKKAHINYMMTYLFPLIIYDFEKVNLFYIILMNLFILLFVWMNALADNFNFNIILWLKGYRIYKGVDINGCERVLLILNKEFSNIRLINEEYGFVSLAGSTDIYLCKKYNK